MSRRQPISGGAFARWCRAPRAAGGSQAPEGQRQYGKARVDVDIGVEQIRRKPAPCRGERSIGRLDVSPSTSWKTIRRRSPNGGRSACRVTGRLRTGFHGILAHGVLVADPPCRPPDAAALIHDKSPSLHAALCPGWPSSDEPSVSRRRRADGMAGSPFRPTADTGQAARSATISPSPGMGLLVEPPGHGLINAVEIPRARP